MGKPLPSSSSSLSSSPWLLQSGSQAAAAVGKRPPGPRAAAGMGTPLAAPGLLVLLLAGTAGLCRAFFSLPLRVSHPVAPGGSPPAPVVLRPASGSRQQDPLGGADGLALASDPGGTLNFLAMVENLQGDSGRGYYLEMLIGTPPQAVGEWGRGDCGLGGGGGRRGGVNFSQTTFSQCLVVAPPLHPPPHHPPPKDGAGERRQQRVSAEPGWRRVPAALPPSRGPGVAGAPGGREGGGDTERRRSSFVAGPRFHAVSRGLDSWRVVLSVETTVF